MSELLDWLSVVWANRMQALLCWSLILPVAWVITTVNRQLSPFVCSWIWRVAYLKLLLVLVSPVTLEIPMWQRVASVNVAQPSTAPSFTVNPRLVEANPERSGLTLQRPILVCLALVWFLGTLYVAAKYVAGWRQANRLVSKAKTCPPDSPYVATLLRLQGVMSVNIRVDLRVSKSVQSPCVFGIIRPAIILPESFLNEDIQLRDLDSVLSHELAHIVRRDLAWNLLHATVSSALFFHPFAWLFKRDWRLSQEVACDEMALIATKSSRADYANLILRLLRPTQPASWPRATVGVSEFPLLKRRLTMLSSQSASRLKYSALASFVLICLAVVTLTPWQPVYKPSPNANSTTETKIGQTQLFQDLQTTAMQEYLALTDEQIVKIAEIKQIPIRVTFAEAIAPLKTVLTDEQLTKFKRRVFPSLMVRAFSVSEVEDALDLTPEQKASVAAIQANLKTRLKPFQDKINSGENFDFEASQRDSESFYEEAYMEAFELLTIDQRKTWEGMTDPVRWPSRQGG